MGELPVEQCAQLAAVDQRVLRTEVAVDDHVTRARKAGDHGDVDLLETGQHRPEEPQDLGRPPRLDQVLAVRARHLAELEHAPRQVVIEHGGEREPVSERRHAEELAMQTVRSIRSVIPLLYDATPESAGAVRVPMAQPTHLPILPSTGCSDS